MDKKGNLFCVLTILGHLTLYSTNLSAQLPYSETFTGQNGKGAVGSTTDMNNVDWAIDINSATLSATSDWFQVQNEVMEAQDVDGEVKWESPEINVSTLTSTVNLSVDFSEEGTLESGDYAKAFYVLDGGAETAFSTNGDNSDDFTATTAEHTLTFSSNTSLKIVIRIKNNAGGEFIRFDNVSVLELSPCTEPTNQATSLLLTPAATSITGSFSAASSSPDNYLVILSTSTTLSSNPIDGTAYNIGDVIGGGTVVTKTSITSFSATGLSQGIQYYFFVFSYNSICTGGIDYYITSPLEGNISTEVVPDIIITEIMQNPSVDDSDGEYFELYNNSGATVDINGWTIKDAGSNSHVIDNGGSLNIISGGYLILGRNSNTAVNGNVTVDYQYSSFILTNSDDEIILINSNGIEVDRVEYDGGAEFPNPSGASIYLKTFSNDNNTGGNWATSSTSEGGISPDKGSPGVIGEASLLPVELINFETHQEQQSVILTWETLTENNNSHFEIERSDNGVEFQKIDLIYGEGTSTLPSYYSFIDEAPNQGLNYYRLKQVDFNGQFEYSSIVFIKVKRTHTQVEIFPNPTYGNLFISFSGDYDNQNNHNFIQVINANGQIIRSFETNENQVNLGVNNLPSGNYILKTTNVQGTIVKRFVKL